jgi:glycosyltransferase involved in cell wall biosynthesis
MGRAPRAGPEIVLDVSRLLSRVNFGAPTGVDRVEMAYARGLLERIPERLGFAAAHPLTGYGRVPTNAAIAFLDATRRVWRGDSDGPRRAPSALAALWAARPRRAPIAPPEAGGRIFLLVSPHHLDQPHRVRAILRREQARFLCLVHDLIPIDYPEYARPDGPARHRRRMAAIAEFADGALCVSDATRRALEAHLAKGGLAVKARTAPLGVDPVATAPGTSSDEADHPYFVVVGTIEPRKNHLMLLNLWRELVAEHGADAPRLHLVGRRGWENENVVDMLDRCPALRGVVKERGQMPDQQMWPLLQGARALLMPSFAEGFGLPVAEALQLGVPVVCSDIAAHREVAGDVADYLSPLDGAGWKAALMDYAQPHSTRRQSQIDRLRGWRAPSWDDHIQAALEFADEVCR